jgi:hypothetical protein
MTTMQIIRQAFGIPMHQPPAKPKAPAPAASAKAPEIELPKDVPATLARAEAGDPVAQLLAGIVLMRGHGVRQDIVEAYKWLHLAAAAGEARAVPLCGLILQVMRPDQISEGKMRMETFQNSVSRARSNDTPEPTAAGESSAGPLAVSAGTVASPASGACIKEATPAPAEAPASGFRWANLLLLLGLVIGLMLLVFGLFTLFQDAPAPADGIQLPGGIGAPSP